MEKYKDYLYYKGEKENPFKYGTEAGFWRIERQHHLFSSEKRNDDWLKSVVDTFKKDYPELSFWKKSKTTQEVVALALMSMIDGGYYEEKIDKEINKYGSSRTS